MQATVSIEEYQQLQAEYAALKFELEQLKRMIFGVKSERFYGQQVPVEQLNLFDTEVEASPEVDTQNIAAHERKVAPKKQPKRVVLPEHLPRKETVIQPDNLTDELVKIGEERSEQLVYVPPTLYVEVTVRPKYAVAAKDQQIGESPIVVAPMPEQFIPKCIAHPSLLTFILVDKFVYHNPLYRSIERITQLTGLRLPKSTVSGWVRQSAGQLAILYEKLIEVVLATDYVQVDETRMEVLPNSPPPSDPQKRNRKRQHKHKKAKKRKTERGWLWGYYAPQTKLTFFDYDPSRGTNNPARRLKNYTGTVQSDGLEVYKVIAKAFPDLTHYLCLVHARRKFEAALTNDEKRAEHALAIFQQVYALEAQMKEKGFDTSQILEVRWAQTRPLLEGLFEWMEKESPKVLPNEPIGKAIGYALKRKAGLLHFLTDGRLFPDTNWIENAFRPVAVGRKNYLFAGSHDAAQWAAIFYSFFACCKANDLDPSEWLLDVMNRIQSHPIQKLEDLLPHKWKKAEV
ncbi:MAG: IS66 family transposase [Bacteroidota bacterium]